MARRACLTVAGGDATHFLQNLVTCDVEGLLVGELTFGALLAPQGKIAFDFFVLREPDGFLLETVADMRDDLVRKLGFYKLRAAVDVAADPRSVQIGSSGLPDPRAPDLPRRTYSEADERVIADYDAARVAAGVPEAEHDFLYGDAFPHDAAMDRYARGGLAMRKGCYVGQEVVSRMEHRGTARRRPVVLSFAGTADKGDAITADGREIGSVGTSVDGQALAIVRLDRAEAAERVEVNGQAATWRPSPLLDVAK